MRKHIPLNFNWKYKNDFHEDYILPSFDDCLFETVNIPHATVILPIRNLDEHIYQHESFYRKSINIEPIDKDMQVYLEFGAIMTYAKVYINGSLIGEHKGGYTPFSLRVPEKTLQIGENILSVYVDARERKDIPPFGHVIDYLTYGGIYREVSMEYRNNIHIDYLLIKSKNILTENPLLSCDINLSNISEKRLQAKLEFVLHKENKIVKIFQRNIALEGKREQKINVQENIQSIKLWDIENPNLYVLETRIFVKEIELDCKKVRFGFRDIRFEEEGFYLNGEKIKIQGLNRHQAFPYVGYAMPRSAQEKDAELLKQVLGVNAVRLSHYPQSDHFLNRCDELGLLVFNEIPGWQHIGDSEWQKISVENVREMIIKDANHPSVIIWGVRINESQDNDDFYTKTNTLAHALDETRPTSGARYNANSHLLEDIYAFNDFSHVGNNPGLMKKRHITGSKKPYIVTEYAGHMYPTKKFDSEQHRVNHALRHLNVMERIAADDKVVGGFGWCMFDYNTHKDFGSGDAVCYHGVMDMFRIEKFAAYAYASQKTGEPVMHILSAINIGEYPAALLKNVYVMTNCDYIEVYKNNDYLKTFYPNRKRYKHIKHPPIIIDDFVGDIIVKDGRFSMREVKTLKRYLYNLRNGKKQHFIDMLKMRLIYTKYQMNTQDINDIYTSVIGGWGAEAVDYRFDGYHNEKKLISKVVGFVTEPHLEVRSDKKVLIEDETYDVSRIVVLLKDENNNNIIYGFDAFRVETQGPIEIIGPKTQSLDGGSTGFWVRTIGESGEARVTVKSERFNEHHLNFTIIKNSA